MIRWNWLQPIARSFAVLLALGSAAPAWAAAPPDRVARLIVQLGSDDFEARTAASAELERIGLPALWALRRATTSTDAEVQRRARMVLPLIEKRESPRAVMLLQRVGACFEYGNGDSGPTVVRVSFVDVPIREAILEALGIFAGLRELHVGGGRLGDAGLEQIALLTSLEVLNLEGSRVTDEGLAHLRSLVRLRQLHIEGAPLTGAGLRHLRDSRALQGVYLRNTALGDIGAAHLARMSWLRTLDLRGTRITDAGLAPLAGLADLRDLYLSDTRVSDAGVKHLSRLARLEDLCLANTRTSDAGLKHLGALSALQRLCLDDTLVTDAGLAALKSFGQARNRAVSLSLKGTRCTPQGIAAFRKGRPWLEVEQG